MKNKDIANFREEISDYETRMTAKTNELRSVKNQLQVVQTRYDEVNQEMEQMQLSGKAPRNNRGVDS